MPWTKNDFPDSLKNLNTKVRNKAIEIANTLVDDENMEEGRAIAIATSRAKDWAINRGSQSGKDNSDTDPKTHGMDQYVTPRKNGWAVKSEHAERASKVLDNKQEAVKYATGIAKKHHSQLIIKGEDGRIQEKRSYNYGYTG